MSTNRTESDEFGRTLYRGYEETDRAIVEAVAAVAAKRDVPRAQIALAWVAGRVTAPIVGATKPHHLDDAVAALDIELTDEEIEALEAPYRPRPVAGF